MKNKVLRIKCYKHTYYIRVLNVKDNGIDADFQTIHRTGVSDVSPCGLFTWEGMEKIEMREVSPRQYKRLKLSL